MTTSSLQKALAGARKPKSQIETSNGAFESCFAGGLDLSEFSSPKEPLQVGGAPKSAAAELLRVKAEERRHREKEEAEEQRMEEIIKKRVSNLENSLTKQRPSNSIVVDALVKMHGQDTSDPSYRKKKSGLRKSRSSRGAQSAKSFSVKKSRRIKY
jgi:hypothetical protein